METTPAIEVEEQPVEYGKAHFFAGKRLEPFSFARQVAAQRCGVSSDSPLESAALVVFLCTLGEGIVEGRATGIDIIDSARGPGGVAMFRARLNKWADEHKISFASASGKEVRRVADEIWLDIAKNQAEPDLPANTEDANPNG